MTESANTHKHTEAFEKLVAEIRPYVKEISCEGVLTMQRDGKKFHFIDVREDHEWNEGHARGAQHLGRGIVERDIEGLIPDYQATIVLYCGGGYRSALATYNIQKMGYTSVLSMAGGIRRWRELNLPEEK
jgi:rhodanese-related sulfurtransferase